MPDTFELPRPLRSVVPLVRRERLAGLGRRVVHELVALAFRHALGGLGRFAGWRPGLMPRLSAVVRPLDDLAEPSAGLRRVEPFGISRRALQVVDLPAGEVRTADVPFLSLPVRLQHERALACADEYTHFAHSWSSRRSSR